MSGLRRLASSFRSLRNTATRGDHSWPGGSFWAQGTQTGRNGYLFGETPPPPGEARKWESWELPWYAGWGVAAIMAVLITYGKPDTTLRTWARPYALKELEEEQELFEAMQQDPSAADAYRELAQKLNKNDAELYDVVMMRNEFNVLKLQSSS